MFVYHTNNYTILLHIFTALLERILSPYPIWFWGFSVFSNIRDIHKKKTSLHTHTHTPTQTHSFAYCRTMRSVYLFYVRAFVPSILCLVIAWKMTLDYFNASMVVLLLFFFVSLYLLALSFSFGLCMSHAISINNCSLIPTGYSTPFRHWLYHIADRFVSPFCILTKLFY